MIRFVHGRRALATLVAAVLGCAMAVAVGGAPAHASGIDAPTPIQVSYTDSANASKAYDWSMASTTAPLGTWLDSRSRPHTSRVYVTYRLTAMKGKHIFSADLALEEASAADCTKRDIEVWRTATITSPPTWNTAPAEREKLADNTAAGCGMWVGFDLGAAVTKAVGNGQSALTIELRVVSPHERDPSYGLTISSRFRIYLPVNDNAIPVMVAASMANGGQPCTDDAPYPIVSGFGTMLQAAASDADVSDQGDIRYEFDLWPADNPTAVTQVIHDFSRAGTVDTAVVPTGVLQDGQTYTWRARASDQTDTSAWSRTCRFTVDLTPPPPPLVSSSNYPQGSWGPVGVPAVFTFSGGGNPDVKGFEFDWGTIPVHPCPLGAYGQMACPPDPFTVAGTIRADVPGGTATVTLSPPDFGINNLSVRSIDRAGHRSSIVGYWLLAPSTQPTVTVVGSPPRVNQQVTLAITPNSDVKAVSAVISYDYRIDTAGWSSLPVAADGSASLTFLINSSYGAKVVVRSHSANGFVSAEATWSVVFPTWPGVTSDVYLNNGVPAGGVGIAGTFTFTPPPAWTQPVAQYQYMLPDEFVYRVVAAGPDGSATITWTPSSSGWQLLEVYAVAPDGTRSAMSNLYDFLVA